MENLPTLYTTLVLIRKNNKILLGEKKRGFAKGTFNGIGGKKDPDETITQAMIRETQEEICVTPTKYELIGKIQFDMWYKGVHSNMLMHIYNCTEFDGIPVETDEIIPYWFDEDEIPFEKMLQDDLLWLPLALKNEKFIGKAKFDKEMNMLEHKFTKVKCIEDDLQN